MCFITYKFVSNAKWEMGSLSFRPKDNSELTLIALKKNICDNLMRIKDVQNFNIFYIFAHYQWIYRRLRKISRAMQHSKWNEVKYSKCETERSKYVYDNVVIVTNMFSNKFHSIYFDNGEIKMEELKKQKSDEKKFQIVKFDDEDVFYVFEKDYIKSIKKKKWADKDKTIATINNYVVDCKKGKCISYIVFEDEILKSPEILKFAIKDIKLHMELANFRNYTLNRAFYNRF